MATPRRPQKHRSAPDPAALAVGRRVKKLRLEHDFSFDAFVEETGLGRGYISELERGLVVPSLHALAKLAAALELSVADLVLGTSLREVLFERMRGLSEADLARVQEVVERAWAKAAPAPPPAAPRKTPPRTARPRAKRPPPRPGGRSQGEK